MKKILTIGIYFSVIFSSILTIVMLVLFFGNYTYLFTKWEKLLMILQLVITLGNVLAVLLVNKTLIENNSDENNKKIESDYRLAKAKILYEYFEEFRKNWDGSYFCYQEETSPDNQEVFFKWKKVFDKFCYDIKLLSPKLLETAIVQWWIKEFERVEKIYKTSPYYDANEASSKWCYKIDDLMTALVDGIFKEYYAKNA